MTDHEIHKILVTHVAQLQEFFPSVKIFVTYHDAEEHTTSAHSAGGGNFYSQLGQVREWLIQQDHRSRLFIEKEDNETDSLS